MICLVTGKIGSGKTLYCVGRAVEHIARGGVVYSNIAFRREPLAALIRKRYKVEMHPEQLREVDLNADSSWHESIEWGNDGLPVLVILDEIHLFFNSRDWAKTQALHADMLSFLSQSRKAVVDVIFIAQVATTLEKQFRVQSEWEFYCRQLADIHVPLFGKLPFKRLLLVQRDNAKDSTSNKPIRTQILPYDKGLFGVYDTKSFLDRRMQSASDERARVPVYRLRRVRWVDWRRVHCVACVGLAAGLWWWCFGL